MRVSRKRTAGERPLSGTSGMMQSTRIVQWARWVGTPRRGRNVAVESSRMSRRRFGRMLAGTAVASASPAFAQASKAVRRIGLLDVGIPLTPDQIQEYSDAFREFGWVEGRNLHIEWRYANNKAD